MSTRIRFRRDTAANWTSNNPTLTTGELGYETNTGKFKIGNNTNAWTALPYSITAELSEGNLNDLKDVTITSAADGDFLRWNGTAWINDAVNLSTDTIGSYVASLVAGTGVTLTNNSGEGATPTVAVTANTYDAYGSASTAATNAATALSNHEADTTSIHGIADTSILVTTTGSQTLTNKTITSPSGLVKGDVGLGNADNTADTAKPVSTAQQTALNLKANLASPTFTGTPTLPTGTIATTQTAGNNTTAVATTAFVTTAISGATITSLDDVADVTITSAANGDLLKWNGTAWVNAAGYATLASPTLTGVPTAPTAAQATNTTQIATTAFVRAEVTALVNGATATLDTLGEIATALGNDANLSTTLTTSIGLKAPLASPTFTGTVSGITKTMVGLGSVDNTADTAKPVSTAQQTALDLKANLASPTFTGTPTLPTGTIATTQTAADSSTKVATTEFVTTANNLKANIASPTFTGTVTIPAGASISGFAPLASPTFTGTPTLPTGTIATTQSASNNSTAVATTAFVTTGIRDSLLKLYMEVI